jgi:hypothetical protein
VDFADHAVTVFEPSLDKAVHQFVGRQHPGDSKTSRCQ